MGRPMKSFDNPMALVGLKGSGSPPARIVFGGYVASAGL